MSAKRNALVEAVTMDDVKRVAKRLLAADQLITTIVGKPVEPAARRARRPRLALIEASPLQSSRRRIG